MKSGDYDDIHRRMEGAINAFKHDIASLRTGRASSNLLDAVQVKAYGSDMPLNQVATVINSLALRTSLVKLGVDAVVLSAIAMPELCESFSQRQATGYMDQGKVVIFAGGTGNPFFTTDSAAALRAAEIGADALFKGTQVDGVYSADPKKDPDAIRYERVSHAEVIAQGLAIMDTAAIALARENHIPIIVYSIHEQGGFGEILRGGGRCTVVAD